MLVSASVPRNELPVPSKQRTRRRGPTPGTSVESSSSATLGIMGTEVTDANENEGEVRIVGTGREQQSLKDDAY